MEFLYEIAEWMKTKPLPFQGLLFLVWIGMIFLLGGIAIALLHTSEVLAAILLVIVVLLTLAYLAMLAMTSSV